MYTNKMSTAKKISVTPPIDMVALANDILLPYTKNANTGNCYEIFFALNILRILGLTDVNFDSLVALFTAIKAANQRTAEKIETSIATVRIRPVGSGCSIGGHKVVGLRNVTQDDGDGGTGDIVLCLDNDTELSISIFAGKIKRDGTIEKCLSNPTCIRYGCTDIDQEKFKKVASQAVTDYKKEMTNKYGSNEEVWNRKPSDAAVSAAASVAADTAKRFNSLTPIDRQTRFQDLMRINGGAKPADMLCLVNPNCKKYSLFNIVKSNINGGDVLVRADSFWLCMSVNGIEVGKTQVKFNNGVYHNGKTSSLLTSWNASCYMNKVFTLEPVSL